MRGSGTLAVIAMASLLLATAGSAEPPQESDHNRNGWYLGLNGIYSQDFLQDDIEEAFGGELDLSGGGGLNVRGGYRVTSWFAAEAMYQWTTGLDADIEGTSIIFYEFSTHSIMGNFKFLLPYWRFQPYIGIGLGAQKGEIHFPGSSVFDNENWGFLGRPSFGIDWIVTDHWLLNVELAGELAVHDISGTLSDTDFFGLSVGGGVQYRF